jgi:hypothetical protein
VQSFRLLTFTYEYQVVIEASGVELITAAEADFGMAVGSKIKLIRSADVEHPLNSTR